MRRGTGIAAILLMLLMMLPTLACAASPKVDRAEQDCCRKMHGSCGEMAKQGCCMLHVRQDPAQLPAHIVNASLLPLALVALLYSRCSGLCAAAGHVWQAPLDYSPPGLLIAATTVLRI